MFWEPALGPANECSSLVESCMCETAPSESAATWTASGAVDTARRRLQRETKRRPSVCSPCSTHEVDRSEIQTHRALRQLLQVVRMNSRRAALNVHVSVTGECCRSLERFLEYEVMRAT